MDPISLWPLRDGRPLRLRAVRGDDAPALAQLIDGLGDGDRRRRFHGAVNGISAQRARRMAAVDAQRELALVVEAGGADGLIADVRCVVDATGHDAEFALMVAAPWRRLGIGAQALAGLQHAAARRGLHWLYGTVLADNAPMLALVRQCGFRATPHRGDAGLVVVESHLAMHGTWAPWSARAADGAAAVHH